MASLKKFLTGKGFYQVCLTPTATEHLALEARLNTIAGRFLVDTGASNTCIALDRAATFGLTLEPSEVLAAGAGAIDMETFVAPGNMLELGNWVCSDVQVVLIDLSHVNHALGQHETEPVDGIIGADILRMGNALIDYAKNRLYLK